MSSFLRLVNISIFEFSTNFVIAWLYWFCIEKYWWMTFDKDLFFPKNQCLLFKKRRLLGASSKVGFTIFPWHFAQVLHVASSKNLWQDFFALFLFCFLRSTNSEKILLRRFSKKNTCAKFQRKTTNSAELEPLEILIFLDERPSFW